MVPSPSSRLRSWLLPLDPQYRERVWGGQHLRPGTLPVGEAWVGYGGSVVGGGPHAGRTLDELAASTPSDLLGQGVVARSGERVPLLVKLLDCADWLSVQVHPNDEQAAELVGPGELGKTEAWHFLETEAGAEIIVGVVPGTSAAQLEAAIRGGRVLELSERRPVQAGDTAFIPAGTLHALGPGMLLYEVQQASDTTYRVYDWDRPVSAGRRLHLDESVAVTDPAAGGELRPVGETGGLGELVRSDYFVLEGLAVGEPGTAGDTAGESLHLLTVTSGELELGCGDERLRLTRFDTALVAGGAGAYRMRGLGGEARLLRASVPPG